MKRLLYISLILLSGINIKAQESSSVREEVFLHVNSDYLLSGETLLYSAFVTKYGTGEYSDLSKILYVELVGPGNERIFQHKVSLENGRGGSEFFIPTLVSTGTYQLVAYTRWMKNFTSYFHTPITIINPFEAYEKPETTELSLTITPESGAAVAGQPNNFLIELSKDHQPLSSSGRLVNSSGDKLADVQTNSNGNGIITFTPSTSDNYQIILENDQGGFEFLKVAFPFGETAINVEEHPGFYQFMIRSNAQNEALRIYNGEQLILERQVIPNQRTQISKLELKDLDGPFVAVCSKATRVFGGHETKITKESIGTYTLRSEVNIPLNLKGNYSISVSMIDHNAPHISSKSFINRMTSTNQPMKSRWSGTLILPDSIHYLPELRGELITGSVGKEFAGENIAFNTIDSIFQLRTAVVDPNGNFNLQIDPMYQNKVAYITLLETDSAVDFEIHSNFYGSYEGLTFPPVLLDSSRAVALAQRSVYNQIENAYYEPAPLNLPQPELPYQIGSNIKTYVLDDYNRFPKMYEHFIEFIPEVAARNNASKSKLKVFMDYLLPMDLPPLILIDGLPTTAKQILSFSPYKIQSIDVSQNRLFLGPDVFDGMVSFHTFSNDLFTFKPGPNSVKMNYKGLQIPKAYNYSKIDSQEADYRSQLYWNQSINLDTTDQLTFYTSDIAGHFKISIEGYNEKGEPVSIEKTFEVTKDSPASN